MATMITSQNLFAVLAGNLLAGLRAAFGLPLRIGRFRVDADQAVVLSAFGLLLALSLDRLLSGPDATFNKYGLAQLGGLLLCGLLALYLVARATGPSRRWLLLVVMFAAVAPVGLLATLALDWAWQQGLSDDHYAIGWRLLQWWFLVVALRLVHLATRRDWPQSIGLTLMLLVFGWSPQYFLTGGVLWYQADNAEASVPAVNVEEVFYAQPGRVADALAAVEPSRSGVVDLYFVGFGGYAYQDVFMREVGHAQDVVGERLDARGRSIALVNNTGTIERLPIASLSNLRLVLDGIAQRMDTDEDILMLFLTSHGSAEHELAVDFWPLALNTINPQDLRKVLDEAGIRWRVLVISACYAGGFLPALSDDNTLIMAAAAADRQSFGCANENEYTYFGRALFADTLPHERSLPIAFEQARDLVEQWERREGIEASRPVLYVGKDIRAQLQRLESRLEEGLEQGPGQSQSQIKPQGLKL
jgi:hypothetical protein